ncbi:hypothetical protein AcW1_007509 [Taiwanofungus camphoratus]|nr:hypothetical protein AcW1_007509 [Antrodia cinnamomea]
MKKTANNNEAAGGEYHSRFNIPGPHLCLCGAEETREHVLFDCPFWIRTKRQQGPRDPLLMGPPEQRGWTPDDIMEFLRLNPMVSTFDWAEILAKSLLEVEAARTRTFTRARLMCHTVGRQAAWQRFHADRHLDPGMTTALGGKYRDFCEWYDAEAKAFEMYHNWIDEGIAEPSIRDDPPVYPNDN